MWFLLEIGLLFALVGWVVYMIFVPPKVAPKSIKQDKLNELESPGSKSKQKPQNLNQ